MQQSNTAIYTDYFRQLAVSHKDLQHDPASESGDGAIGAQRFCRYGAEEVIEGLRTKVSFPALLIEMYETKTTAISAYSISTDYSGAFSVYGSADVRNFAEQEQIFTLTEKIMDDIKKQIWQDHVGPDADRCLRKLGAIDFSSFVTTPVGPVFEKQFGWRCEFSFSFNNPSKFTEAPEAGTFL